jgi:hypothetical protein
MAYMTLPDICTLGQSNSHTALAVMESLLAVYRRNMRLLPWRLMYPLYLRARYAASAMAHDILNQLPFIPYLARACRSCGCRTQRRVFDVLLCSKCTRNPNKYGWMVPARIAVKLGAHHIPFHAGPRGPLVLAVHIQEYGRVRRMRIRKEMNLVWCRATIGG